MNRKIVTLLVLLITPFIHISSAEIDQLTNREQYQDLAKDFTEILNVFTNELIEAAIENYNLQYTNADISQEMIHRHAAFEIYKMTAGEASDRFGLFIPSRVNLVYALGKSGKGPMQLWIESEENANLAIHIPQVNIYEDIFPERFNKNVVVKVGGEFVGPDKIDHFFDQGYSYWLKSGFGVNDEKALAFGVESEFGWYGLKAGGVFSFADLRANWSGYNFYRELFSEENPLLEILSDGSIVKVRDFDWSDYVDWQYDELKNPCIITRLNLRRIYRHIEENYDKYSTTYYFLNSRSFFDCCDSRDSYYLSKDFEYDERLYTDLKDVMTNVITNVNQS